MILAIYGVGGLGREVYIIAKKINQNENKWKEIIFVSDLEDDKKAYPEYKILNFDEVIQNYETSSIQFSIALGEPIQREKLYKKVKKSCFVFATLIHPGVYIDETTTIGEGSVICEGCTITCNVNVGHNCYIQPHAIIGHDIKIGNHTVIGSNCEIGGADIIGDRCFFGFLSGTKEKILIENDVIISAGAIVFRDLPSGVIVMGNPGRIIRKNEENKVFKE